MFEFKITVKSKKARTGVLKTPHGEIETPVFMPVGTQGAVKTLAPWELESLGSRIILANTYHLYLRPGEKIVASQGGLHQFMAWSKPILTDSGGFQVYSIGQRSKITEEGIKFRSHIDGAAQQFTPEKSIQIQKKLGADIIMVFDDVVGSKKGVKEIKIAMERTHRWLERSIKEWNKSDTNDANQQALFGIVQGGLELDLRKISSEFIASQDLPGNAIGGLAMPGDMGEEKVKSEKSKVKSYKEKMWEVVELVNSILPENKPRYLMGVGEPADLVKAISLGCDMFDCVLPTRLARHGAAWTLNSPLSHLSLLAPLTLLPSFYSRINLLNSQYKTDSRVLDPNCPCPTCSQGFSRSYLHHLLTVKELLVYRLLSIHNLYFLNVIIQKIKAEVKQAK